MAMSSAGLKKPNSKSFLAKTGMNIVKHRGKYMLVLPGFVWFIIFAYIPIFGLSLAFKTFTMCRPTGYGPDRGPIVISYASGNFPHYGTLFQRADRNDGPGRSRRVDRRAHPVYGHVCR
jgi:hypothetical protein